MADNRQLDIAVARLLGLSILGEAPCLYNARLRAWEVIGAISVCEYTLQPVYLAECWCKHPIDESKYFDHIASCLEVIPLYHKHDTLARQALEQICDEYQNEHKLFPHLHRWSTGEWIVKITKIYSNTQVAHASDKSFPLAICKALAQLEEKE